MHIYVLVNKKSLDALGPVRKQILNCFAIVTVRNMTWKLAENSRVLRYRLKSLAPSTVPVHKRTSIHVSADLVLPASNG